MKEYIASVTDKEDGQLKLIRAEYKNKDQFKEDLRGNGYRVRFITTEEKFDEDCEKWHSRNEQQKRINRLMYASDKKHAERMGMSVTEYRNWCKEI